MTLKSLRWTLGALAGLSLAACAETTTDQPAASAEAPQPLAEQAPPQPAAEDEGRRRHRDPARLVEKFDQNKNGKLEVSELPEHKREKLAGADTDKDGALSSDELKAAFEARRKEHHAPQM